MSDNVNYYDLLKSNDMSQYFSYLNNSYIKMAGPRLQVFKLDKKATLIDDVYGSVRNGSAIYLPPFSINAIYLTNPWMGQLSFEPYQEVEQNIKTVINFDNMVSILRDLKNKHTCDISIQCNSPTLIPSAKKIGNTFIFYVNGTLSTSIDLTIYRTVKSFVAAINATSLFTAIYTGVNDEIANVNDFNLIEFTGSILSLYSIDTTYANITDVIEMGDLVLTEKWRMYEVKNAMPGGDFGWNWTTYVMEGGLIEVDVIDGLPGDYRTQIEKHQYGLPKVNKE